jgi:glycosyltransferase involved in cell wall biosynthesis
MAPEPYFSVIIPTYNRGPFIKDTIQSVLDQNYQSFEVIVVDDGSTDNTGEIIQSIPSSKIRYYKKKNEERGAARNFGMDRAKGEYITFLDSDDRYYPPYLERGLEMIKKHNSPKFFHLGYEVVDQQGNQLRKVDYLQDDDIYIFVRGNPLSCLGVFLHHEIAQKHKFREYRPLAGSEDWEMWTRVAVHYGIKVDNRISAAMVQHEGRSLAKNTAINLIHWKLLSIQYLLDDARVQKELGNYRRQIWAFGYTYIALNLALAKARTKTLKYLIKGIVMSPKVIFTRRFLAIIKHSLLP